MSLILSIETATSVCSVALHNEGALLAEQTLYIEQSHSGLLAPSIKSLLSYCSLVMNDIEAVAVSKGPGSYTGLRIGVSTAKGICDAIDKPLIAINTLEAMAFGVSKYVNTENSLLCPMIDARRMEVYYLLTDINQNIVKPTEPLIVDSSSFSAYLKSNNIVFFGNGSDKCKTVIKHPNASFINNIRPSAAAVGFLAYKSFEKKEFEDVAYFDPFYLKDFRVTKPKAK